MCHTVEGIVRQVGYQPELKHRKIQQAHTFLKLITKLQVLYNLY
jgi:hypothetical protein